MLAVHVAIASEGSKAGLRLRSTSKKAPDQERRADPKTASPRDGPKTDPDDKDAKRSAMHQARSDKPAQHLYLALEMEEGFNGPRTGSLLPEVPFFSSACSVSSTRPGCFPLFNAP